MFSIIRCWNIRMSCQDVSGKVIASLLAPLAFCKLHPAFGFKDAFFGPHPLLAVHFDFAMCALQVGTWRHFWHMIFFQFAAEARARPQCHAHPAWHCKVRSRTKLYKTNCFFSSSGIVLSSIAALIRTKSLQLLGPPLPATSHLIFFSSGKE